MAEGLKENSNISGIESLPQHEISSAHRYDEGTLAASGSDITKTPNVTSTMNPEVIVPINKAKDDKHLVKELRREEMTLGKRKLYSRLNKQMKIEMTDGRVLVGIFLCTDRDANVILGSCTEYLNPEVCGFTDEPRILGLVMVPGRHIVSIHHDASDAPLLYIAEEKEDFYKDETKNTTLIN